MRRAPIYYNEPHDFYAVSRHADVARGVTDRDGFISRRANVLEFIKSGIEMPPGLLIYEDPPTQTIHRKLVSKLFTAKAVAALEPKIRAFSAACLLIPQSRGCRVRVAVDIDVIRVVVDVTALRRSVSWSSDCSSRKVVTASRFGAPQAPLPGLHRPLSRRRRRSPAQSERPERPHRAPLRRRLSHSPRPSGPRVCFYSKFATTSGDIEPAGEIDEIELRVDALHAFDIALLAIARPRARARILEHIQSLESRRPKLAEA